MYKYIKHKDKRFRVRFDNRDEDIMNAGWNIAMKSGTPYLVKQINKKFVYFHHVVMSRLGPKRPFKHVDHKNGNSLDNRLCNLQYVTISVNVQKSKRYSTNRSGLRGVSWCKNKNKWVAAICKNYKQHHLGYFTTRKESFKEYQSWAKLLYDAPRLEWRGKFI